MAKKSRTPPPPRRVQAPKTRTAPRSDADARKMMPYLVALSALGLLGLLLTLFLISRADGGGGGDSATGGTVVDFSTLPGLQTGAPPWNAGLAGLDDRLRPLDLPALSAEGEVVHTHQHLDVWVNGEKVKVPAGIGIQEGSYITTLHTHDDTGLLHVESPEDKKFSLGQFFGAWGVRLDESCIGDLCDNSTGNGVKMWVNGKRFEGDPATLELKSHQEIAVVFGKPPAKIPDKFDFPPGT